MECPETLSKFEFGEIVNIFRTKHNVKSTFNYTKENSIFGKVSTALTKSSKSSIQERKYLYHLWNEKIKVSYAD